MKKLKKVQPIKQMVELLDFSKETFNITGPWPYDAGTVKEIKCHHKLEYLTGHERIKFMEEAWRVAEDGAKMEVVVCYWTSVRAIQDPTLQWPPMSENSFLYFNKGWREANNIPQMKCNWGFSYGYNVDPETSGRNQETQGFWLKHYLNTALDLHVTMTKEAMS